MQLQTTQTAARTAMFPPIESDLLRKLDNTAEKLETQVDASQQTSKARLLLGRWT